MTKYDPACIYIREYSGRDAYSCRIIRSTKCNPNTVVIFTNCTSSGKVRRLLIEKFYKRRVGQAAIFSPNPLNGIVEKGCPNDPRDSSLFRYRVL